LKFGTLAERTDKQPGVPGTQQPAEPYFSKRARFEKTVSRSVGSIRKENQMSQARTALALLVAAIGFSPGCGRKATDEIDFGTINKSVYQNHYFGLTVALPPEWSVQDQETRQKMMELGGKMVAGDDKNLNAAVKASEMTTVNLFAAFKHPVGTPVPYNPNIMCLAERVRHMPGIKEGKDYLFHAKRMLESSHMQVSFPKEMSAESMGGQQFGVMHTEMSMAGEAIRQKYYAAIIKDYALVFIVSFTTEEDELSLEKTLKTVEFK
jgi:hypothetical protein